MFRNLMVIFRENIFCPGSSKHAIDVAPWNSDDSRNIVQSELGVNLLGRLLLGRLWHCVNIDLISRFFIDIFWSNLLWIWIN